MLISVVVAVLSCVAVTWLGSRWSNRLIQEASAVYGGIHQCPRMRWALPWFVLWFVGNVIGLSVVFEGMPWAQFAWFGWLITLGLLGLIDARTGLLPNELTLALMISGLAWHGALAQGGFAPQNYTWGMVLGWALPFTLNLLHERWRGSLAIGEGDAKLLAGLGAWLGLDALPLVWIIACAAVLVYTAVVRLIDHHRPSHVTFGPFLAMGASGAIFINYV